MKKLAAIALVFIAVQTVSAANWRGITSSNHCSGPQLKESDLAGKVVMVDCWGINCPPCRALLPRMEELWKSFKHKPFILLGSHCQQRNDAKIAELVKSNKLTYPIYQNAGLENAPNFSAIPFIYVVNHKGKIVYAGNNEREATAAAVDAFSHIGTGPTLYGDVELVKLKALEKQLVLGKPVKSTIQNLKNIARKSDSKSASQAEKAMAKEAADVLSALEESKKEIAGTIESMKDSDPEGALKLIKAFSVSFPAEASQFKNDIPALRKKAAEFKKQKARRSSTGS